MSYVMEKTAMGIQMRPMALSEALQWSGENLAPGSAHILAESPEKVIWRQFSPDLEMAELGHCLKLYIFDEQRELRWQREYAQDAGMARLVVPDASAQETYARYSSYLLGRQGRKLCYAEHFSADAGDGSLHFAFSRY